MTRRFDDPGLPSLDEEPRRGGMKADARATKGYRGMPNAQVLGHNTSIRLCHFRATNSTTLRRVASSCAILVIARLAKVSRYIAACRYLSVPK